MEQIRNKIWFTYISRIETTKRLKLWDKVTELLLVWYSLITVLGSGYSLIVDPKFLSNDRFTNFFFFSTSIAVLVFSLVLTSQNLKYRSIHAELNYKRLQRLYNKAATSSDNDYQDIQTQYDDLIAESENHTTFDFDKAKFRKTHLKFKKCCFELGSSLDSNHMTPSEFLYCQSRILGFWSVVCGLFLLPLTVLKFI